MAFLPDFTQISKVASMSIIKSGSVIFPVLKLKRKGNARTGPLLSDLKMIVQLDIAREKIGDGNVILSNTIPANNLNVTTQ